MSTDNRESVREIGFRGNGPPRRGSGRLVVALVALLVGLVLGVPVADPGTPIEASRKPRVSTTMVTTAAPGTTTTTSGSSTSVEDYEARIEVLEKQLAAAQQQVFELGLEADTASVAATLGCDESIGAQYPVDWQNNSYFVGPVAFYRLPERLPVPSWDEVFAVVEVSDSVTPVVPASERDSYSLIWNPEIWRTVDGDYTFSDGNPAVTLRSCDGYASVVIGGFVSNRTYSASLAV